MSIVFVALAFVPAGAHLFSLTNKMRLDREGYVAAQRAYDGWNLFGIVVIAALLSTLALSLALYRKGEAYALPMLAFLCIAVTQLIFWTYTFPANRETHNWTALSDGWEAVRSSWEYSHAASAVLVFFALLLLGVASVKE
jgi:hypothetical protein